jgi:cellulose synthase/poly-beta-1,6-N-acetylglucosamine synthase-like glycosyltransferase
LSTWIRQTHRWLSITFTIAVIANIVAMFVMPGQTWIGFLALVPLIPLLCTGLYMFFQPYRSKARQPA